MTKKNRLPGIEMIRQDTKAKGKTGYTWYGILLSFSCFLCGLIGCVGAFLDAFPVSSNHKTLYIGVLVIAVFYEVIWLLHKFWRWLLLLLLPLTTILQYFFEDIKKGFILISNSIQIVISSQGNNSSIEIMADDEKKIIISFLLITFLWAGVLWFSTMVRCVRTLTVFSLGSILTGILAVGQVPVFWAVCLMLFCCLGNFAGLSVDASPARQKGVLLTIIAGFALLAMGDLFAEPYLEPCFKDKEQVKTRIQKTSVIQELMNSLPKWENPYASGGIGHGELGQVERITFSGNTALRVTTDEFPKETVYLRGYIGADYTGKSWDTVEDTEDEQIAVSIFSNKRQELKMLYNSNIEPFRMDVIRENASPKYQYRPYLSMPLEDADNKQYSYWYFPRSILENTNIAYMNTWENYWTFVNENYLSYPEEQLPRLLAQCREHPLESVDEIKNYIVSGLDQMADYNLEVGKFPEDEEFTEYFLYEAKQGYCSHFATAAVLMFRMYGIPARYVEGYIAPVSDFHKKDGEYTANITDKRAHAWAEIYTQDGGWQPVEATPGYSIGADLPGSRESEETETQTNSEKPQETSEAETQSEKNINKAPEKKAAGLNTVIKIGLCISGIFLLILCIHLRRKWILRRRKKKNVREIFHDMYEVLQMGGLTEEVDCQEADFPAFAARHFTWMKEQEFAEIMNLVMRANFGRGVMKTEEIKFMRDNYRYICNKVYRNLPGMKKIIFRYCKVYH